MLIATSGFRKYFQFFDMRLHCEKGKLILSVKIGNSATTVSGSNNQGQIRRQSGYELPDFSSTQNINSSTT